MREATAESAQPKVGHALGGCFVTTDGTGFIVTLLDRCARAVRARNTQMHLQVEMHLTVSALPSHDDVAGQPPHVAASGLLRQPWEE